MNFDLLVSQIEDKNGELVGPEIQLTIPRSKESFILILIIKLCISLVVDALHLPGGIVSKLRDATELLVSPPNRSPMWGRPL